MANILLVNVPYAGHLNPTLPLTKELASRRHQVTYLNAEEFRGKIEETGAAFHPYHHYPEHPSEKQKKTMCFQAAFDTALQIKQKFDLLIYEMFFIQASGLLSFFISHVSGNSPSPPGIQIRFPMGLSFSGSA